MKQLLLILIFMPFYAFSYQPRYPIPPSVEKYAVHYGNPEAKIKVHQYISLSCGECITFFKKDFKKLMEECIDSGEAEWVFIPYPIDLLTLQSAVIMEGLSDDEKGKFLEDIVERSYIGHYSTGSHASHNTINHYIQLEESPNSAYLDLYSVLEDNVKVQNALSTLIEDTGSGHVTTDGHEVFGHDNWNFFSVHKLINECKAQIKNLESFGCTDFIICNGDVLYHIVNEDNDYFSSAETLSSFIEKYHSLPNFEDSGH